MMFSGLGPYGDYFSSEVPGMSGVPAGWSTRRLRSISQLIVSSVDKHSHDDEQPVRLCNYVDVYRNDVITRELPFMTATARNDEIRRFGLRRDDVVVTKDSESWTDIGVPALVAYEADDFVCGYHLAILRTNKSVVSGAFLARALQVPVIAWQLHVAARGVTRYGLSYNDIRSVWVPLPPLVEQAVIVKYLAHAHRRIDRAIDAKQRLIALLEEQKHAVVNLAVTRGLEPGVKLKDSGIDWLESVPDHWGVSALRHRYQQALGKMLDSGRMSEDGLLPYLRNIDVQWGEINRVGLPMIAIPPAEYGRYTVQAGDLLVCEGGEVGRSAIWDGGDRTGFQKALHRLRPHNPGNEIPRYLMYVLRVAARAGAFDDGRVSTIAHLTGESLRRHRFAWPPVDEQRAIVEFIDSANVNADAAVIRARREIELLEEFRTRLTADVVTGQVDVRDIAARLPDISPAELAGDVTPGSDEDLNDEATDYLEDVSA